MAKTHTIELFIKNSSGYEMSNPVAWFDSGQLASNNSFPVKIPAGQTAAITMYENDGGSSGCSGFVNYSINGGIITIAYSNPSVGKNKIGAGTTGKGVWDRMDYHNYYYFDERFPIGNKQFNTHMMCSGGKVNNAEITLTMLTHKHFPVLLLAGLLISLYVNGK